MVLLWCGWVFMVLVTKLSPSLSTMRNISLYPVCISDKDCTETTKSLCFQYMCYPWATKTDFRWCNKEEDCREGEEPGSCFRHRDRRNINFGICINKSEMKKCTSHSQCQPPLKCTNSYCGDPAYFGALQDLSCQEDHQCQDRLTGETCCFDLKSPDLWTPHKLPKRCCTNPSGHPVIPPPNNLTSHQISKLDIEITHLKPLFLDLVICEALNYPMMARMESCRELWTTTTQRPMKDLQTSGAVRADTGLFTLFMAAINVITLHLVVY